MNKYLFLLVLFVFYVILISGNETTPVFMNLEDSENRVKTITLKFSLGINSKELVNRFNIYENKYLIRSIKTENHKYDVKCDNLDKCYKEIFRQEDEEFSRKYVANGFNITELSFLYDE